MRRPLLPTALFLLVLIAVLSHTATAFQNNRYNSGVILWGTYKYTNARTGFVPREWEFKGTKDFSVAWNVTANLCITSEPVIADINGDGVPEVVFDSCDGYLYAVSSRDGRVLWKFKTGGGFVDPAAADLDGDGLPEILSAGDEGVLYCLNGDGNVLWKIDGGFYRGAPLVADLDGDGRLDVAMGSVDGHVYIRLGNGSVVKVKVGDFNPRTLDAADVDGDGVPEIVAAEGEYIHVIDYHNGSFTVYSGRVGHEVNTPVALWDIDGDGVPEAIFSTSDNYLGIYSIRLGRVTGMVKLDTYETASPPSIGRLWRGGPVFIVQGTMSGLFIYYTNLTLYKEFPLFKIYTSSPVLADVDGDGHYEILVGEENGQFDIIDPLMGNESLDVLEWVLLTGGPVMGSASVADVNYDGVPEIFIGSRDYRMYMIEPAVSRATNTSGAPTVSGMSGQINRTSGVIEGSVTATTSGEESAKGTSRTIGLARGVGHYEARLNWQLITGVIIVSLSLVAAAYIYTRD